MTPTQTTFFFAPDEPLVAALGKISSKQQRPPSYQAFVRELGALMATRPRGSLILAGVPSKMAACHVSSDLSNYMEFAKAHGLCESSGAVGDIEIPCSTNIRAQQLQLVDIYSEAPISVLGHRHRPQFMLGFDNGQFRAEPLVRLRGIVNVLPAQYYLIRGAHLLRPAGASVFEAQNQLRFFEQLAHQTGRTHVLMANAVTIGDWLETGENTHETHACFLRPYDPSGASFKEFAGILKGYDALVPRAPAFDIASYAETIHGIVSGCPYRFGKWISRAMTNVLANGGSKLSWDDLRKAAPPPTEQRQASEEYNQIRKFTSPLEGHHGTEEKMEKVQRRRRRPGEQNPRRDPVAQSVA